MKLVLVVCFFFSVQALGKCRFSLSQKADLNNYDFVVVPGVFNEFISFYMTEYKRYLVDQGLPKKQYLRVNNSSFKTPEEESFKIKREVERVFDGSRKKIIFGHSKGALETLYYLKGIDPETIEQVYLIQAPLDGISSYKVAYKKIEATSFLIRIFKMVTQIPFISNRYNKFSTEEVRRNVSQIITNPKWKNKLTFVASKTSYEKLPLNLKLMGKIYQDALKKVGDGVVLYDEQVPHGIKDACIREFEGDHGRFVVAHPWRKKEVKTVRNFLDALLFKAL